MPHPSIRLPWATTQVQERLLHATVQTLVLIHHITPRHWAPEWVYRLWFQGDFIYILVCFHIVTPEGKSSFPYVSLESYRHSGPAFMVPWGLLKSLISKCCPGQEQSLQHCTTIVFSRACQKESSPRFSAMFFPRIAVGAPLLFSCGHRLEPGQELATTWHIYLSNT